MVRFTSDLLAQYLSVMRAVLSGSMEIFHYGTNDALAPITDPWFGFVPARTKSGQYPAMKACPVSKYGSRKAKLLVITAMKPLTRRPVIVWVVVLQLQCR